MVVVVFVPLAEAPAPSGKTYLTEHRYAVSTQPWVQWRNIPHLNRALSIEEVPRHAAFNEAPITCFLRVHHDRLGSTQPSRAGPAR
jgi:hypothetical protein